VRGTSRSGVRGDWCGGRDADPVARGRDFEYELRERVQVRALQYLRLVYLETQSTAVRSTSILPPRIRAVQFHESRNPFIRYGRTCVQRRKAAAARGCARHDADESSTRCAAASC